MPVGPVQLQMDRLSGDIWIKTRGRRGNVCAAHIGISQATGQRRYLYQSINRIFYPMCALHTWDNLYRQNNDSEIQSFLSVNQSRESPDFPEVLKNAHNTKETRGIKV